MTDNPKHESGGAVAPKKSHQRQLAGQKLGAADAIVMLFALLGLLGSYFLWRSGAPPILISFFLSTGVAALVYRFLGGIQSASFGWGTLKLGGTMAALVGTAFLANYYLEPQMLVTVPVAGRYEWQWAGDSWKGYVDVGSDGAVKIQMSMYQSCAGSKKWIPLLEQSGAGKAEAVENRTKLRVKIPVKFINYDDKCNRTGSSDVTTLSGDLDRKPAFAGVVEYQTQYGAPVGDMILVKSYTSGVH
jgi:hypothetical protein